MQNKNCIRQNKLQLFQMKKKVQKLDPLPTITKTEASYERLMLELMSKLVNQTRQSNLLVRQQFAKGGQRNIPTRTGANFREKIIPDYESIGSPPKHERHYPIQQVMQSQSGKNIIPKSLNQSNSALKLIKEQNESPDSPDNRLQKLLIGLDKRLQTSEQINKKLLEKIQKLESNRTLHQNRSSHKIDSNQIKQKQINLIQKALGDKLKAPADKKGSYVILSQILPYSDRREMKVKFKISDVVNMDSQAKNDDLKLQTAQWLGMVYRATASICWNMLLNNYLNFQEVKILFTENIVFNFIQFMEEVKKIGKVGLRHELTAIINSKSVDILEFLCRQYPQTKIQAPNITLRQLLPQIDNQGRIKYDMVHKCGIPFLYQQDGDYTAQIMKMMNFIIDQGNQQFDQFQKFMKDTFDEVFIPASKRRKFGDINFKRSQALQSNQDVMYRDKVKSYTKYLIGRKISKNTAKYTLQQIEDGIFFVKSSPILRIVTKWVQQLIQYFQKPEQKIKNSYNQNKDHSGKLMYISALIKNGIYKATQSTRDILFDKINKIRKQCQKMEYLLTSQQFTSESSQVHLSEEQISVGLYCSNLKSAISSYICSELNYIIHYLLKIPRQIQEESLGNDLEDFKAQARKDLNSVNLVTFKIFDILRCKIHSNQQQIIWIVKYLLKQSQVNKDKFSIVRIKDRLNLGTRDIMINAQINRGLVCQIQLSVTSNTDKKQELLDSYNHFLYELKRSELGPVTENVSIWSNLEQRYSYFQQLMKGKSKSRKYVQKEVPQKHSCGVDHIQVFKRPIICKNCNTFFAIPQTCLLNVICNTCNTTFCGECYYYNFLNDTQRKQFIFDKNRIFKPDMMSRLVQYTDPKKRLPETGFFIKKKFLKKQLSFYMAIQKNKNDKIKDAPSIELVIVQTIIRQGQIINRQLNKNQIEARLQKGQFFVKDYDKSQFNNYIIFYFQKKQTKKLMTLKDLKAQLQKPDNRRTKVISIIKEPSYISNLQIFKKQSQKIREMNNLQKIVKQDKITVYMFNNVFLLAQVAVKGAILRAQITKKVNISAIKKFADKQSDIVSMQYKNMTTQLQDIETKIKKKLYQMLCQNLKKLFLTNGNIESIKCFKNFPQLQAVFISQNKLKSLQGIQTLKDLMSFIFDSNQVQSLIPFSNSSQLRYLSGNDNKIKSLKGLQGLQNLRSLSLYQNQIQSIEEIRNCIDLQELYLRDNPITDISIVQNLTGLTKLFIGKLHVKNLPNLSMLTQLKSLSLQSLNLQQIPTIFANLKLKELWLSYNQISQIQNLQNQTQLVFITLSGNKIKKIKNIEDLQKLQVLKLRGNQITVVQGVHTLDCLKYLNLEKNPIDDLGQLASYEITFRYVFSDDSMTPKAVKQLAELQLNKSAISSGED